MASAGHLGCSGRRFEFCHPDKNPRVERIISEKSDLFMLKWLGKHGYTLNMFHNVNCSITAMVPREMDDWVRHALLRRTGVIINQAH